MVVLEFWATWCHPCLRLHPEIVCLAEHYDSRELVTYGIVYEDTPTRALAWLQAKGGVPYDELRDDGGSVARASGVHASPQMFLIGPDGRLLTYCLGCAGVAEDLGATIDSVLAARAQTP